MTNDLSNVKLIKYGRLPVSAVHAKQKGHEDTSLRNRMMGV